MNRCKTVLQKLQRTASCSLAVLLFISGFSQSAAADPLAPVTGVEFDGTSVTWDALDVATGYNIYYNFRYLDTVSDGTSFRPEIVGTYSISAFDGQGNFSPLEIIEDDIIETTNSVLVDDINVFQEAPQNVTGTVYSRTAGEIFWDRDNGRSLEYYIDVNGKDAGFTTGNSFYLGSLPEGVSSTVTLRAFTSSGITSEPITLIFDTRGQSYPIPALEVPSDVADGLVQAPRNAYLSVYSSTAAELFWDRAPLSEEISFTEIYRDNVFLGITAGTSFFDDTRTPGTSYSYELVAVDVNGNLSNSTFIDPGPFDRAEDQTDEELVLSLLEGISAITNANPHVQFSPLIQAILNDDAGDLLVKQSTEVFTDDLTEDELEVTTYACDTGTVTVEKTGEPLFFADIFFDDCNVDNLFIYGPVSISAEDETSESISYFGLVVFDDDQDIALDGDVTYSTFPGNEGRVISYTGFSYTIFDLTDEVGPGTFVFLDQTVAFDILDIMGPSTLTTEILVSSAFTNERTLTVTTEEVFTANAEISPNYTTGRLVAESPDGERLTLSADTGDAETWFAELTDADGVRSVTGVWDEKSRLPCIVLEGECR